ncbi:MAG: hypothetical protein WCI89_00880 [bacterium]
MQKVTIVVLANDAFAVAAMSKMPQIPRRSVQFISLKCGAGLPSGAIAMYTQEGEWKFRNGHLRMPMDHESISIPDWAHGAEDYIVLRSGENIETDKTLSHALGCAGREAWRRMSHKKR